MPSKPIFDNETLREQILMAGKQCAKEEIFMTVKALRARGVKGNESRIYRIRKQLVDSCLLPSHLILEHPARRVSERNRLAPRDHKPSGSSRGLTWDMVRLYGGRRRLRREFGVTISEESVDSDVKLAT